MRKKESEEICKKQRIEIEINILKLILVSSIFITFILVLVSIVKELVGLL